MKWNVQDISPDLSARMRNMSFVCALMVVCIHCSASASAGHDVFWLVQMTSHTLCAIAVPYFFCISGFLLAGKMGEDGWWSREISKRAVTLLVPFFVASAIYLAFTIPIDAIKDMRHGDILKNNPFTNGHALAAFGLDFSSPPSLAPLWYVRALFFFVVLSPIVKWIVSVTKGFAVIVFFVAYYIICPQIDGEPMRLSTNAMYDFFKYGCSLEGLSYFSMGIALRRWPLDMRWNKWTGALLAAIGFGISLCRTIMVYNGVQPQVHWSVFAIPCYL